MIYIVYASATGNAEVIAKRLYQEAISPDKNYQAQLSTLNDLKKQLAVNENWERFNSCQSIIICVCSTTGNGDVPENGDLFYRFMKRCKNLDLLRSVRYGVLGLGDTNYDKFNMAAKVIDKRMSELGAVQFCERGDADDATGLEQVVEPWIVEMWNQLDLLLSTTTATTATATTTATGTASDAASSSSSSDESMKSVSGNGSTIVVSSDATITTETTTVHVSPKKVENAPIIENQSLSTSVMDATCPSCFISCTEIDSAMEAALSDNNGSNTTQSTAMLNHSEKSLHFANIVGAKYLTSTAADKQVLHMEFDIANSGIQYSPGDAIGIYCQNDETEVLELLNRLNVSPLLQVRLGCSDERYVSCYPSHLSSLMGVTVNVRDLFLNRVDITAPASPSLLRVLAQYCSDMRDKSQLMMLSAPISLQGAYRVQIQQQRASLLDVLQWYPSCKPNLAHLLQVLPMLQHRYYSIASSQLKYADQIHIALTIVEYVSPPPHRIQRYGVCTRWLKLMAAKFLRGENVSVPFFLKSTPEFRLPRELHTPIIMIGPGTGVAPFRGFLQHREAMMVNEKQMKKQDKNTNWLFFGCRKRDRDFLYKTELRNFEKYSPLQLNLFVATSQESNSSRGLWYGGSYVQDFLRECGAVLVDILQNRGGYLYICGDAAGMAQEVHRVMRSLVEEEGNQTREEAEQFLLTLEKEGRYQKDVWS